MTPETAHPVKALLNLGPDFWGLPRIAALVYTYVDQLQRAEDGLWTLIDGLDVDTADRWMLEVLAKVVGEPSRPADTEALRILVKARILVNRSAGRLGDLFELARLLFGLEAAIRIHETTLEAVVMVGGSDLPAAVWPYIARVLDDAAMATVRVALIQAGTFLLPDLDGVSTAAHAARLEQETGTTFALTSTYQPIVSCPALSNRGNRILVCSHGSIGNDSSSGAGQVRLTRDGSVLVERPYNNPTTGGYRRAGFRLVDEPGQGEHVYQIDGRETAGNQNAMRWTDMQTIDLLPEYCTDSSTGTGVASLALTGTFQTIGQATLTGVSAKGVTLVPGGYLDAAATAVVELQLLRQASGYLDIIVWTSTLGLQSSADFRTLDTMIWQSPSIETVTYILQARVTTGSCSAVDTRLGGIAWGPGVNVSSGQADCDIYVESGPTFVWTASTVSRITTSTSWGSLHLLGSGAPGTCRELTSNPYVGTLACVACVSQSTGWLHFEQDLSVGMNMQLTGTGQTVAINFPTVPAVTGDAPADTWYPDLDLAGPAGTWSQKHDSA